MADGGVKGQVAEGQALGTGRWQGGTGGRGQLVRVQVLGGTGIGRRQPAYHPLLLSPLLSPHCFPHCSSRDGKFKMILQ